MASGSTRPARSRAAVTRRKVGRNKHLARWMLWRPNRCAQIQWGKRPSAGRERRDGKRRRGEQQAQTLNRMRAAWNVTTLEEGEKRLEQLARFLERDYESAARSLREGMAEMFTLQRLKLPPSLYKCLATTNLIESPQRGVALRTANVKYWRDQGMVEALGCLGLVT